MNKLKERNRDLYWLILDSMTIDQLRGLQLAEYEYEPYCQDRVHKRWPEDVPFVKLAGSWFSLYKHWSTFPRNGCFVNQWIRTGIRNGWLDVIEWAFSHPAVFRGFRGQWSDSDCDRYLARYIVACAPVSVFEYYAGPGRKETDLDKWPLIHNHMYMSKNVPALHFLWDKGFIDALTIEQIFQIGDISLLKKYMQKQDAGYFQIFIETITIKNWKGSAIQFIRYCAERSTVPQVIKILGSAVLYKSRPRNKNSEDLLQDRVLQIVSCIDRCKPPIIDPDLSPYNPWLLPYYNGKWRVPYDVTDYLYKHRDTPQRKLAWKCILKKDHWEIKDIAFVPSLLLAWAIVVFLLCSMYIFLAN